MAEKMNVIVTVGTHPQQFNRLMKKVDELLADGTLKGTVYCQSGASTYRPKHYAHAAYMALDEFEKRIEKADLVISHGGEGNIGLCLKHRVKCIAMPRLQRFDEHTNDHQTELVEAAADAHKIVAVWDAERLGEAVRHIRSFKPDFGEGNARMIAMLDAFVKQEF
jgi:UDP-N-acetylglucosamine transferase subunit ALG13